MDPSKPTVDEVRAYVGLGSNLGDRDANIKRALEMLDARDGILVVRVSSFIDTDPFGGPSGQGKYLNAAAALDTRLAPRELLLACTEIENSLGRTREVRWGPRTIDIDILLYGEEIVKEPDLEIPHPRMHERLFVLSPLCHIAREVEHPILGETIGSLLLKWFETASMGARVAREAWRRGAPLSGGN